MSDLGLQLKRVLNQSDQLKEGQVVQKTQASYGVIFFFFWLALFAYMPLMSHAETREFDTTLYGTYFSME
jgi:hypothetical protein